MYLTVAPAIEKRIGGDKNRFGPSCGQGSERRFKLLLGARVQNLHLHPKGTRGLLDLLGLDIGGGQCRVDEHGDGRCRWNQLMQEPQPLSIPARW